MASLPPNDNGWTIIKVDVALFVVNLTFIILRCIARSKRKGNFGIDDYLAFIAFILLCSNVALNIWAVCLGGVGYPDEELTLPQIVVSLKADYILTWLNLAMVLSVKLSVLFLYRKIFATRKFQIVTFYFGIIITIHLLILMLLTGLRCLPVVSIWTPTMKPDMCLSYSTIFLVTLSINAVIDTVLLALPLFMIRRLQMNIQKKLELAAIFLLGGGAVIASILRITQAYDHNPVQDNRVRLAIWSLVEPAVGLVCACLPTLRPLFPLLSFGKVRNWYGRKSSRSASDGFSSYERPVGSFSQPLPPKDPLQLPIQVPEPLSRKDHVIEVEHTFSITR